MSENRSQASADRNRDDVDERSGCRPCRKIVVTMADDHREKMLRTSIVSREMYNERWGRRRSRRAPSGIGETSKRDDGSNNKAMVSMEVQKDGGNQSIDRDRECAVFV